MEHFISGQLSNAPTLFNTTSTEPFDTNNHLCYRTENESFFAMEYWPNNLSPRWLAYKLSPENYGSNGCNTFTRSTARCYFRTDTWEEFESCTNKSDPFHTDHMLVNNKLFVNDFSNTGHDRGHLAPAQAFSWNVCGWYQTFTMANMSPQRGFLNQQIWADLEQQILTWAVDEGPIYVVTGSIFRSFPASRFQVYQDGVLNSDEIYPVNNTFSEIVERHQQNFADNSSGEMLRPLRNANPTSMNNRVRNMRIPTGYYSVIFKPETETEPAIVIGFMLPHSFENLNLLVNGYVGLSRNRAFWAFVSRIDLIEQVSGVQFPGIPQALKKQWGDEWFFSRKTARDIRAGECGIGSPAGVLVNSVLSERIEACTVFLTQ